MTYHGADLSQFGDEASKPRVPAFRFTAVLDQYSACQFVQFSETGSEDLKLVVETYFELGYIFTFWTGKDGRTKVLYNANETPERMEEAARAAILFWGCPTTWDIVRYKGPVKTAYKTLKDGTRKAYHTEYK